MVAGSHVAHEPVVKSIVGRQVLRGRIYELIDYVFVRVLPGEFEADMYCFPQAIAIVGFSEVVEIDVRLSLWIG